MAAINDSVCQYLVNSMDSFLGIINTTKNSLTGFITGLKTSIRSLQYSATDKLQEMEADVYNQLDDIIPSINTKDKLDTLIDIIDSCPFLSNSPKFGNPLTVLKISAQATREMSVGRVDVLTSALPEMAVGKTITTLFNNYGPTGFDFTKIIPDCFQIIECVDSLCDNDISDRYESLRKSMKELYLLTTGGLDRGKLYQDLHLNSNQTMKIELGVSTYNNVLTNVNSKISDSLKYVKSFGSGLGF